MTNIDNILQKAHSYFSAKEYDKALFLYSQACSLDPTNIEYQLYCIFCDFGFESDEKAQSLFDYFLATKGINLEQAALYVQNIIKAYDGDNEKMMQLFKDISLSATESIDAISYDDFMQLVEQRGSFKEAYQDIMFSTKVAINSKEQLIDFIDKLIENNFETTAYKYLDGFNRFFSYDQDLNKLYEKLERVSFDNNR